MKKLLMFNVFILLTIFCYAGKVTGLITDVKNTAIPFASVTVKGTIKGTTANNVGVYSITLDEGEYTFVVQHVGYKSIEKKVAVSKAGQTINFILPEQQYNLGNITVTKGVDPAYEIIRNAIKKRAFYETEHKKYTTEVYIKGQMKLRDFPNKFMGTKIDFEDGDSSKKKIIFLSETVAKYSVDEPKKKVEVISTKVSGQSDGFGFSSPQLFSFYQNNIQLFDLNPRGFISPIANNALNFYRYKFEGTFFENNQMVNRIKVMPKRKYEPLFNGYINIIENEWRIQSVQLVLYKENQMQLVDTLKIEQLYVPSANGWIIKQQTIYPAIKFFGFDATGNFVQVYDKFDFNPQFSSKFFDNIVRVFADSSNKKSLNYWDSIRPVPLLTEEVIDYKKKDSLEHVRKDPKYLDSLDKKRNTPSLVSLLTTGQTFTKEKRKSSIQFGPFINDINYNTVEGVVFQTAITYRKSFSDVKRDALMIKPYFRYGFSNKHFNPYVVTTYNYGKRYYTNISVSGGKRVYQFDNSNPISPLYNTISTLQYERNYMKIYEAYFGRIGVSKETGKGFIISADAQLQDRIGLSNTTEGKWKDHADRAFTPNFFIPRHQALIASINVRWQPGTKYVQYPESIYSLGSDYPTFNLSLTQGIKSLAGSDVDYTKWRFSINDDMNMKLFGRIDYRVSTGGFLNDKDLFLPDFQHFTGNQLTIANQYLNSFQLMPYYFYSNTSDLYSTAHIEYHLNGFLTNKIPLFKKLNWFLVTGTNALYLKDRANYAEGFIGLENIFKMFRVDWVRSFSNDINNNRWGIRIALPSIVSALAND